MAYTTNELIRKAYILGNVVARGLQSLSGVQLNDGLDRLNDFIALKTADMALIPFYQPYEFDAVIGQETYYIDNLLDADTLTFIIPANEVPPQQNFRYGMQKMERAPYWGIFRAVGIQALPIQWQIERLDTGSNISVYFSPQQALTFTVWGKFSLASLKLNQDLSLPSQASPSLSVSSRFWQVYLLYGLADYLCEWNSLLTPPSVKEKLREINQVLMNMTPLDLTNRKFSFFNQRTGINYGDVNIGHGFRP